MVLAVIALLSSAGVSQAGPCTAQIAQVEQQIAQLQAAPTAAGTGEPSAPQSVGAQLHHEPTPGAVANSEHLANAEAEAALARARQADASGNAQACAEALRDARLLYGID